MRVVTHRALARKRRSQAVTLSLIGVAVLLVGLYYNFRAAYGVAYVALIAGTLLSFLGVMMSDRWVALPRPDQALSDGLAAITGRVYALYHWALPSAGHVLLAPWGLTVFMVHNHDGPARVEAGRWRDRRPAWKRLLRFARRPLRHPGPLLELEIEGLREALKKADPGLAEVPIDTAALFSHPAAKLERVEPDLPVLTPEELEPWVKRSLKQRPRLAPSDRLALERALDALAAERMGDEPGG